MLIDAASVVVLVAMVVILHSYSKSLQLAERMMSEMKRKRRKKCTQLPHSHSVVLAQLDLVLLVVGRFEHFVLFHVVCEVHVLLHNHFVHAAVTLALVAVVVFPPVLVIVLVALHDDVLLVKEVEGVVLSLVVAGEWKELEWILLL